MKQKMKKNAKISYGDWTPYVESSTEQIDLTQVRKLAGVLNIAFQLAEMLSKKLDYIQWQK